MLNFRSIELGDKAEMKRLMALVPAPMAAHSFSNLYLWQDSFGTSICFSEGFLFVRSQISDDRGYVYLQPIGGGDQERAMSLLREHASAEGRTLVIFAAYKPLPDPNSFVLLRDRSLADYIYSAESLRALAGKKLQPRRNHLNRFRKLYPMVEVRPITAADGPELEELLLRWGEEKEYPEGELGVLRRLMRDFDALSDDFVGIVAEDEGRAVAFSFGFGIGGGVFDVMMEKADPAYDGAFAFINNELAKRVPERFALIDREEDMGLQGLRRSKLAYRPEELRLYPTAIEYPSLEAEMYLLWKACFGDEDEFIFRYIFFYSSFRNRVIVEDSGRLASFFNVHVFSGRIFGCMAYLYALAVDPGLRGRGYGVEAIRQSLVKARSEGCVIALTIQANKDFNGWQHAFDFGRYAPYPLDFSPIGFDLGTGDHSSDLAICRILDIEAYFRAYVSLNPSFTGSVNYRDPLFPDNDGTYVFSAAGTVERLPLPPSAPAIGNSEVLEQFVVWDVVLRS